VHTVLLSCGSVLLEDFTSSIGIIGRKTTVPVLHVCIAGGGAGIGIIKTHARKLGREIIIKIIILVGY